MIPAILPTQEQRERPNRILPYASGYFPTGNPSVEGDATGIIPECGILSISSTIAATITIRIYNKVAERWEFPGTSANDFQKVFGSDVPAFDYFRGPAGAKYHLKSSAPSNAGYDNGKKI